MHELYWDTDFVGFASIYLEQFDEESKSNDEIDKELYSELLELDTRLQKEKKRLNDLGGTILREAGLIFEAWKDYDCAEYYLHKCWNDSKMINEADATVYQRLVDIDSTLGTELSKQLYWCLYYTTRWDIIKVLKFPQMKDLILF